MTKSIDSTIAQKAHNMNLRAAHSEVIYLPTSEVLQNSLPFPLAGDLTNGRRISRSEYSM